MIRTFFEKKYDVVDLNGINGSNEYAFDLISALEFMYEAVANGHKILGGDIYVYDEKGRLTLSCDNWYSEKESPQETLDDAMDYLKIYFENSYNSYPWKIVVVISDGSNLVPDVDKVKKNNDDWLL